MVFLLGLGRQQRRVTREASDERQTKRRWSGDVPTYELLFNIVYREDRDGNMDIPHCGSKGAQVNHSRTCLFQAIGLIYRFMACKLHHFNYHPFELRTLGAAYELSCMDHMTQNYEYVLLTNTGDNNYLPFSSDCIELPIDGMEPP